MSIYKKLEQGLELLLFHVFAFLLGLYSRYHHFIHCYFWFLLFYSVFPQQVATLSNWKNPFSLAEKIMTGIGKAIPIAETSREIPDFFCFVSVLFKRDGDPYESTWNLLAVFVLLGAIFNTTLRSRSWISSDWKSAYTNVLHW